MKHDPNQTKTVVILLAVLVGAIVFVVMRVSGGGDAPAAATQQAAQSATPASAEVALAAARDLSRDPFNKPPMMRAALEADDALASEIIGVGPATVNAAPNPYARASAAIKPAELSLTPLPGAGNQAPAGKDARPAGPRFELLATARSSGGWSAVIKTDDSEIRVVNVNDRIGSGFKVVRIETGRAVLTDGRIKVIAKRPKP